MATMNVKNNSLATRFTKLLPAIGLALIIAVGALGSSSPLRKAPADKIAVSYGGGPFEGNAYQRTVQPGSGLIFNGWADKWYEYPTTTRTFIISKDATEGDKAAVDFVEAPSADRVPIDWELSAYFKLNTKKVRQFHENVGLKYQAWTEDGWLKMLNDTFRQQLEAAVQTESRKHTADEYQSDSAVIDQVRGGIASSLKDNVNTVLGDAYFCGPTFDRTKNECPPFEVIVKKPTLPAELVESYQRQKTSANDIVTAENAAKAAAKQAEGQRLSQEALNNIYRDPAYVEYLRALAMQECAKNSNCTLVVTPGGTNINVAAR